LLELFRRHVVARAPEVARVGEADLARSLVGQLDEARVVLPHRPRDGVPADPGVEQRARIAALAHQDAQLLQVPAAGLALRAAPFALAVDAFEPRADGGQLQPAHRIDRKSTRL